MSTMSTFAPFQSADRSSTDFSGDIKPCKLSINRKFSQESTGPFIGSTIKMIIIIFSVTRANGYDQLGMILTFAAKGVAILTRSDGKEIRSSPGHGIVLP